MCGTTSLWEMRLRCIGVFVALALIATPALAGIFQGDAVVGDGSDGWSGDAPVAVVQENATRASRPQEMPGLGQNLVVAADGSGDFRTVQAAIDAAPVNSATRTTILIRKGTYPELLVIAATNNAKLNPRRREMVSMEADDFHLENLTLHNTTPKGGSQAETIRVRADRVVLDHCDFKSFQDTLRLDGRVYVRECSIEGDVDFIWGAGTVYFDRCDILAVHDGYLVQSRNGADKLGYVFVDCRIDTAPDLTRFVLARIDPGRYPHSQVAFVHCAMGKFLTPAGFIFDGPGAAASKENIRFEEFRSTDLEGKPLDVSTRVAGSRQLSAADAARLRDVAYVLGGVDKWNPNSQAK